MAGRFGDKYAAEGCDPAADRAGGPGGHSTRPLLSDHRSTAAPPIVEITPWNDAALTAIAPKFEAASPNGAIVAAWNSAKTTSVSPPWYATNLWQAVIPTKLTCAMWETRCMPTRSTLRELQ